MRREVAEIPAEPARDELFPSSHQAKKGVVDEGTVMQIEPMDAAANWPRGA